MMSNDQLFLVMWIGFMLLVTGAVAAIFFWGVRARQFAGQERARYLALMSGIPGDGDGNAAGDRQPRHGETQTEKLSGSSGDDPM